jgi:hypothetical protein
MSGRTKGFPLLKSVKIGTGTYKASYPMGIKGSFSRDKVARSVKLTAQLLFNAEVKNCGATHPIPHKFSSRGT